ncbi:uncharacterized protein LOC106653253 isoform X2 [Trichogramma pretiosum]|uniref:uncharacterized protein LOC106653253 isoform X2 n=1 Tax=Trichogramma pretiosum TaxID=7493 RepID=UPI000C7191DF|nr:uncharacterized protein LOC106653253 isoform X2 [Trichogramma pretiosum]
MEEQVRSDSKESSSAQSSAAATATAGGVAASGDKGDKENNSASNVEALICWLYVSRTASVGRDGQIVVEAQLPRRNLEEAIRATEPSARWNVSETHCGLIAGFARESDADKLLQREDFGRIFQTPVQVARFCDRDSRHRQAVLLRDVPAAIPLQDIDSALARQGIASGAIERLKHYVRVEVLEASHYEQLLRHGLDFFGATRFCAIPERWRGSSGGGNGGSGNVNNNNSTMASALGNNYAFEGAAMQQQQQQLAQQHQQQQQQNLENVLQCYRCQGFWHVAANCRHLPRCVRCGEPHNVEFCTRPRNNPVCCHCSGPHHAGNEMGKQVESGRGFLLTSLSSSCEGKRKRSSVDTAAAAVTTRIA